MFLDKNNKSIQKYAVNINNMKIIFKCNFNKIYTSKSYNSKKIK